MKFKSDNSLYVAVETEYNSVLKVDHAVWNATVNLYNSKDSPVYVAILVGTRHKNFLVTQNVIENIREYLKRDIEWAL
jgi:hypothetical protein